MKIFKLIIFKYRFIFKAKTYVNWIFISKKVEEVEIHKDTKLCDKKKHLTNNINILK